MSNWFVSRLEPPAHPTALKKAEKAKDFWKKQLNQEMNIHPVLSREKSLRSLIIHQHDHGNPEISLNAI